MNPQNEDKLDENGLTPTIIDKKTQALNFIKRLQTSRRLHAGQIATKVKEFNIPELSEYAVNLLASKPRHEKLANDLMK